MPMGTERTEPLFAQFYGQPRPRGPDPSEVWDYWIRRWKTRIAEDYPVTIVVDADRRIGATRIGKSTLALRVLRELDPSFTAKTVAERIAGSPSELARFVIGCQHGQGFLYDEGMWGARGRDANSPEGKMIGEILGTLASRGAVVLFCTPLMVGLDAEVKGLATARLLVRRRGIAEVHYPKIQLDLERPRLLPFRRHRMSPLEWEPLKGPLWEIYSARKTEMQDQRMRLKLEEQRVYQARRLGQRPDEDSSESASAGGAVEGRARAPEWACTKCGSTWGRRSDRDRHSARCGGGG